MFVKQTVAAAVLAAAVATPASADDFMLDYAALAASGRQITLTRVPVVASNGSVTYKDVTIRFNLGTGNTLTVAAGYPKTVNSPALQTGNLTPGRYVIVSGSKKSIYRLTGPSIGQNDRATWKLTAESSEIDIVVYAGPIKGHPMEARITKAGITASGGLFGAITGRTTELSPDYFSTPALVTLAPSGGDLDLVSYSKINTSSATATDGPSPKATARLFKCTVALCS